jgi:hypothetical protein
MISIEKFRKNLGDHANEYTEEGLIKARSDMYQLVNLAYEHYIKHIKNNQNLSYY